jgi:hypothetical protein
MKPDLIRWISNPSTRALLALTLSLLLAACGGGGGGNGGSGY